MPNLNKINLNPRDGLALWYICTGQFHVWDRGDGVAEVSRFKFPSSEDAIGYIHGDPQPEQNESGYLEMRSAFPGVWCAAGKEPVALESIEALESILRVMVNLEARTQGSALAIPPKMLTT